MGRMHNFEKEKEKRSTPEEGKENSFAREVAINLNMAAILYFAALGIKYAIIRDV